MARKTFIWMRCSGIWVSPITSRCTVKLRLRTLPGPWTRFRTTWLNRGSLRWERKPSGGRAPAGSGSAGSGT